MISKKTGHSASHMVCLKMWLVVGKAVMLDVTAAPPKLLQDRCLLSKIFIPGLKRKKNKQKGFIKFKGSSLML